MSDEHLGSRLAALLRTLKPKTKEPVSAKVPQHLDRPGRGQARRRSEGRAARLAHRVRSPSLRCSEPSMPRAVTCSCSRAALCSSIGCPATARTTKDVDGLIRGDLDQFILALDEALDEPWGPLTLRRGEVEVVNVPTKIIKPRRFDIILELRGVTWRRIQIEVSPDEAGVSDEHETIEPPPLAGFGLPDPDALVGITLRFQIAQKFHAVSDPHEPPDSINERARDVVDLLLLRDLVASTGNPTLPAIKTAAVAVFDGRAAEAEQLGRAPRHWPPTLTAHTHWADDYARAAASGSIDLSLDDAVAEINAWIVEIAAVR